nr:MAG TPA: hypothetical protein [Inoviridae sp.]
MILFVCPCALGKLLIRVSLVQVQSGEPNSILQEPLSDSSESGSCVSSENCSNSRISSNVTASCVLFSVRTITAWSSHRNTSFTNAWITWR